MEFSAAQIAMLVNGKLEGDPGITVRSFGKIEEAQADQLAFLSNPKYEEYLYTTKAGIVLISEALALKKKVDATLVRVADPYTGFATLLAKYQEMMSHTGSGIQEPCYISKSALIGEKVFIGAFAYLGEQVKVGNNSSIMPGAYIGNNVTIGSHTVIHPGVKIYHGCVIGSNVIIHGGTIIGSDGFGFAPQADGSFKKVPQIGNVVVEDNVEIGSNTTIDRATMGSTVIRKGAKLDNLIQVGHNVEIGNSTVIAAQAGISGSTHIGKNVMIGGQAGIVGHITVGDGAKINAQSGVSKSLEAGKAVTGSPAHDFTSSLRSQAVTRRLPDLERRIKELEAIVQELKQGNK